MLPWGGGGRSMKDNRLAECNKGGGYTVSTLVVYWHTDDAHWCTGTLVHWYIGTSEIHGYTGATKNTFQCNLVHWCDKCGYLLRMTVLEKLYCNKYDFAARVAFLEEWQFCREKKDLAISMILQEE